LPQEHAIAFKTKHDTAHARPLAGSPRYWLIFGSIAGQNIVPGQQPHRFGHGDVMTLHIQNSMGLTGAPAFCFFGHDFIAGHLLGPTSLSGKTKVKTANI
jgi:hypothetical protein